MPFYILAVFCLNFFRDPERDAPRRPGGGFPADGKVVAVMPGAGGASRISIFLNIFDVHVNRTPIAGKVACINYKKGQFLVASKEDASQANEQNVITVEGVVGGRRTQVTFKQIAGLIARRIICYKRVGDIVATGRAHRPDQIRLARGRVVRTRMGGDGEGRASASRRIERDRAHCRCRQGDRGMKL